MNLGFVSRYRLRSRAPIFALALMIMFLSGLTRDGWVLRVVYTVLLVWSMVEVVCSEAKLSLVGLAMAELGLAVVGAWVLPWLLLFMSFCLATIADVWGSVKMIRWGYMEQFSFEVRPEKTLKAYRLARWAALFYVLMVFVVGNFVLNEEIKMGIGTALGLLLGACLVQASDRLTYELQKSAGNTHIGLKLIRVPVVNVVERFLILHRYSAMFQLMDALAMVLVVAGIGYLIGG